MNVFVRGNAVITGVSFLVDNGKGLVVVGLGSKVVVAGKVIVIQPDFDGLRQGRIDVSRRQHDIGRNQDASSEMIKDGKVGIPAGIGIVATDDQMAMASFLFLERVSQVSKYSSMS